MRLSYLAVAGLVGAFLGGSAATADVRTVMKAGLDQAHIHRAMQGFGAGLGEKRVAGYFRSAPGRCHVTLMVGEARGRCHVTLMVGEAREIAAFATDEATRVDVSLLPGQTTTLVSGKAALEVTCGGEAAVLLINETAPLEL